MNQGAYSVHKRIRQELENYIKTQYFGKSPLLFDALKDELSREGVLYREPYIESLPAYTQVGSIEDLELDENDKKFFKALAENEMGVYHKPYAHQAKALEYAVDGREIFVSTGTGSGKTECFMWPMITKLMKEARNSSTWDQRGVRVMIMYPMNALVSDQLSRLRRLIGDSEGKFAEIFRECAGGKVRRPQFGMYTGRTPYSGTKTVLSKDKNLAATYERMIKPESDREDLQYFLTLQKQGRIPAKKNLNEYVAALKEGKHDTNPEDAELLTRFEMQKCCPDILITNYSMLEYMLLRNTEQEIWKETRRWLAERKENRLLFIIDEAHMYRGSSGGEVALLIKRLLHKLQIGKDKVQFILTTASMPSSTDEDWEAVRNFSFNLTGKENFEYITGERKTIEVEQPKRLEYIEPTQDLITGIENAELEKLNYFWQKSCDENIVFNSIEEAKNWMYQHLLDYEPFAKLIKKCRGDAIALSSLGEEIYLDLDGESAAKAVSLLISIAQLATSKEGEVLFPAKMHLLFRGVKGVFACVNPKCENHHTDHGITVGDVFINNQKQTCPSCGSMVYELYEDRRCGALFYKGYIDETELKTKTNRTYLWHYPGQRPDLKIKEIHLYIPEKGFTAPHTSSQNRIKPCYINMKSGFIDFADDSHKNDPSYRKLYYCEYSSDKVPEIRSFIKCPHCNRMLSNLRLISFSTRGNQSFNNLIKAQFDAEPPVEGKKDIQKYPNEGRKVLLFSDSRQRAAVLARDMSKESDMNAARRLFMCAVEKMNEKSLDDIYGYFLEEAIHHKTHIFGSYFQEDCKLLESKSSNTSRRRRNKGSEAYDKKGGFTISKKQDKDMMETILRLYCGNYNTLIDDALSWVEPMSNIKNDIFDFIAEKIDLPEEDELEAALDDKIDDVFNAWFMDICDAHQAIGQIIPNTVRNRVRRNYKERFGLSADWDFSKTIIEACGWNENEKEHEAFRDAFQENLLDQMKDGDRHYFIGLDKVKPVFKKTHEWFRCPICSAVTPRLLQGMCPCCGSDKIELMNQNGYEALDFWRKPVFDALDGETIRTIATEEHTAQLSHKDQQDDVWSKTEEYELRFQDMVKSGEVPVDILSSTTTMEVGIDIGSLVAVGLRNIPPMRENYQQRAGRAGRRGSSLSTIVTFCENGAYDALYFKDPTDMFRGDPRRPWIDVESPKLLQRHLNMIILQDFLHDEYGPGLDEISTLKFIEGNGIQKLENYVLEYNINDKELLNEKNNDVLETCNSLIKSMRSLEKNVASHRELYESDNNSDGKSLLDALYEEGVIPTYSFPKNVVSLYISNYQGKKPKVEYQVERGLEVAIGEYAPGRSVVVDKKTYQIGGLYYPGLEVKNPKAPIRKFMEDPNYKKSILLCEECGWFGIKEDYIEACPFCGNKNIKDDLPMIKPWGFAPKNGKTCSETQIDEAYSKVQTPLYSTLPNDQDIKPVYQCKNIRQAMRRDQNIILINRGPENEGFTLCPDCGAIVPGKEESSLKKVWTPYNTTSCSHANAEPVNLGYDFKTDMLVLEFWLDAEQIDTDVSNIWLHRAGKTLAESIRLAAGRELDIEFTELQTGYRIRTSRNGLFMDIYMYDSLSSGAGYSKRISEIIPELLMASRNLLQNCNCSSACYDCLKHYRNQYIHSDLDRFAARDLLEWGVNGKIPDKFTTEEQWKLLMPLIDILKEEGIIAEKQGEQVTLFKETERKNLVVYPAMLKKPIEKGTIYLSDYMLKYEKPMALSEILSHFKRG